MKLRPKLAVAVAVLIAVFILLAMILPTFASSGDYGVNTGGNTATPAPTATPGSQYCSESEPGIWSVKAPYSNYPTIQGDDFDTRADCESEAQERAANAN